MRAIWPFAVCLSFSTVPLLRAADRSTLADADAAYAKRDDVSQANIAMMDYERNAVSHPEEAVESYWKASRAAWWVGDHAKKRADRLALFDEGVRDARHALALQSDSVEAHFWLGSNLGSYGEAKGVMKSLSLVKPVRREMAEVLKLNERFMNGAAYQVLGVIDYEVPGIAGGSKKRAQEELDKALAMGPNDPFVHYYRAEFYHVMGKKAEARAEVETLRTLDVAPDDVPELKRAQQEAADKRLGE